MDEIEQIKQKVAEGKLAQALADQLLNAYFAARGRDAEVQALAEARSASHRKTRSALLTFVAFSGLLGAGLGVSLCQSMKPPAPRADIFPVPAPGANLDESIHRLEQQVLDPRKAQHYAELSSLYSIRFYRTGDVHDQYRADEAHARAGRYQRRITMKTSAAVFMFASLILLMAFVGMIALFLYNGLSKSDERSDRQWGQVQAQLQRRMDLVPVLVETVKTYMKHEHDTLVAVAEARQRASVSLAAAGSGKDKASLEQMDRDQHALGDSLMRMMAVVEKYPDLKANQSFQTLQDQLEGTENRIATERMRYNDVVGSYNEKLRVFPSNMIGSAFGFAPRQYFEAKIDAEDTPALKLKD